MNKILYSITVILILIGFSTSALLAQMDNLQGNDREFRYGIHAGNKFRTSFFNDGTYGGRVGQPPQVAGEWPIGEGHYYLVDGNIFVGSEVTDTKNNTYHILSENKCVDIGGSRGDKCGADNHWCTFLPLGGFANANEDKIAMARGTMEWENSWPNYWPDIADPSNKRFSIDGWAGAWNGYFGKNTFNADEESYFVADDYENKEFFPDFIPDTTDLDRGGLGIRIYVRGFQWSKAAVEDGIFCLYDIENIGTYLHDKMVFGYKIGNNMGEDNTGSDAGDDNAYFDRDLNLAYMSDGDNTGANGWTPVGYMGGTFLESPGNPYDGIDNDNDGRDVSGPVITTSMFQQKILTSGDPVVIIDYDTFERTLTTLGDLGGSYSFTYNTVVHTFTVGDTVREIGDNLIDDNLNGLIDENRGHYDENTGITTYLYEGYKCIDYFSTDTTTNGKQNLLLDERRNDKIDNDGDWEALFDDVGTDGMAPGSPGYPGPDPNGSEGNGQPDLGEPHFDITDINETDMLGLTSFNLYDWSSLNQYDDEPYWDAMQPGAFISDLTSSNVELLFGSGYFPLVPGQTERFSMGVICGEDLVDITYNKVNYEEAYTQNYNFAKAPYIPTVRAVAGDNRVTLFWDDFAESSVDPISSDPEGKDFEGYKIYRSTDPGWKEMKAITDSHFGTTIGRRPMAQFDLDNDYSGNAPDPTQGVHFFLGENTGLRHFYVDTTAINGFTYFYAVTAYDHGDPSKGIDPSECSKFVAPQANGEFEMGTNVVMVRPEAPSAGYKDAAIDESGFVSGLNNTANGGVRFTITDADSVLDNHEYQITFTDTVSSNNLDSTYNFTLVDLTAGVTVLDNVPLYGGSGGLPVVNGFQLEFVNNPSELNFNPDNSGWNQAGIPAFNFVRYVPTPSTKPVKLIPADFEVLFSDSVGVDISNVYYRGTANTEVPAMPVNFTVINTFTNERVPFAFRERHVGNPGEEGIFSFDFRLRRSDEILLLANADPDSLVASWQITCTISSASQPDSLLPGPGTVLTIDNDIPFLSHDTFTFTTTGKKVDNDLAKVDLENIKVVPNPYIVTNSWEPINRYASGRGDRQLHFTRLPAKCTIRIFNVRGQLVQTLKHDTAIDNGTEIWDMLSRDNLEIAYGIYIYHVEAEGIGEKIGKFVIIK